MSNSGIDWGAVWNGLNSNLVVAAIVGVIVAFALEFFSERAKESGERKTLAILLGYEIARIRKIVLASIPSNRAQLDKLERDVDAGNLYFLNLTNMDLSRTIYDKQTTNLSLLPDNLLPTLTEIYFGLELTNHIKRLANDVASAGTHNLGIWLADRSMSVAKAEADRAIVQFISYAEMEYVGLERIAIQCGEVITGLSKIVAIDETKISSIAMVNPDTARATSAPSGA